MHIKTNRLVALMFLIASFLFSFISVSTVSAATATITTNDNIVLNASSAGDGTTIDAESIGITTTCNQGYDLTISTSTSSNLYLNGDTTNPTSFTAVDGTSALNSNNNTNKWGYTLTNNATSSTIFSPLSTTASSLRTISQTTGITTEAIPIYYGIKADSTINPGTYSMGNNGVITYYLTMNPLCNVVDIAYDGNNADAGTMGAVGTGVIHTGVKDGDTVNLIASNFSRTGYGFAGWSIDPDAGTKLLDNDNTNNPIVYGPQESVTLPEGFTANDTDNDGIVKLYAVWLQSQGDLQGWMGCSNLDTATYDSSTGALDLTKKSVTALTDQRDNDTYAIARLADGKCWMIENLRLDNDAAHNSDGTLAQGYGTSTTYGNFSGLADAESENLNDSATANSLYYIGTQSGTASINIGTNNSPNFRMPRYNNLNTSSRATNPTSNSFADNNTTGGMYSYGNYYTWHAALANTIYYSSATATDANGKTSETVNTSLCPAGWKLPYGRDTGNGATAGGFSYLDVQLGGPGTASDTTSNPTGATMSNKWRSYPNNFLISGYFLGSSARDRGTQARYWTSTTYNSINSHILSIYRTSVTPGNNISLNKFNGCAIRCVASDPQTYTLTYDANGGSGAPASQTATGNGSATFTLSNTIPTRSEYLFYGWNTEPDGSGTFYIEGQEVNIRVPANNTVTLYAIWTKDALLDTGQTVNQKLKRLAGNSSATYSTQDTSITALERSSTLPNGFTPSTENTISDAISPLPIYAWYDSANTTIYYYSDATNILMNRNSISLFEEMRALSNLTTISTWDTTKLALASRMFYYTGYSATSFTLDLSSWDTSHAINMAYMFFSAGRNATTWSIVGLDSWSVSNVVDMWRMFGYTAYSIDTFSLDLSSWDVSNVTSMQGMFWGAGYSATTWSVGDLSTWDTSKLVNTSEMFMNAGYSAAAWSVGDLSSWDTSNVTGMSYMFASAGHSATTWSVGDLSSWDVSSVTRMGSMFMDAGYSAAAWSVGDLSSWDTSNVTGMSAMFGGAGRSATTWSVGDLSSWDVSSVTSMFDMFGDAGYSATTWFAGDLSSWNTSNVTDMREMFSNAGRNATSFSLDLSSWDVSNVTDMYRMFYYTGYSAADWSIGNLPSWNPSNVTDMREMFSYAGYNATSFALDLSSWDASSVTNMERMFYYTGHNAGSFTLNLSSLNASSATTLYYMLAYAGYNATTFTLDFSSLDASSVTGITGMCGVFQSAGYSATSFALDLSSWNTPRATDMSYMFQYAGYSATTWSIVGLSSLDTSSVTDMSGMFGSAGYSAANISLDLSSWDTSSVTDMSSLFSSVGYKSSSFTLNLSSWNTSSVTDMRNMFYYTGHDATSFTLNLSSLNTSNVTNMFHMFNQTGYNARGSAWSVTIPQTNNGAATGPIANTTGVLYGQTTSVSANPPSGKSFTLAN